MKFKDSTIVEMSLQELEEAICEYINSHKGNFGGPEFDINDWTYVALRLGTEDFSALFEKN